MAVQTGALAWLTWPNASVAVAVKAWLPGLTSAISFDQWPLPSAVAVPITLPPSYSVISAPASALPLMSKVGESMRPALVDPSSAGGCSISMLGAVGGVPELAPATYSAPPS